MKKQGWLEKQCRELNIANVWFLLVGVIGACIMILCITTHYIHLYEQEPEAAYGRLEWVSRDWRSSQAGIMITVDGVEYTMERPMYTKRSYGLDAKNYEELKLLKEELEGYIGSRIRVEYIQMAEKSRDAIRVTVFHANREFMDREQALMDHVGFQKAVRRDGTAICLFVAICLIPVLVCMHKQRKETK